ncbi:MAG TPA: sensor histidine kinase [Thermoanaerobaculia bacterium]|nr:sensor histidine kinase [Thermoanaerobaculia bacterium]
MPPRPEPDPMAAVVERVRRITTENERLFRQLIAGERRYRGLARAVWQVQEEERRRLARDLHDGLGQTLTALKTQLARLEQKAEDLAPALRERLADSVELAGYALNETREMSRLLRPPVLDDLGLLPALSWLARTLDERAGLVVELRAEGFERRLPPDLETLVFRVVQEALTNVLKHSGVPRARVTLALRDGRIALTVSDRGAGFDTDAARDERPGSGLRGMRDRVELFGGTFRIVSAPGEGTEVEAVVPLAGEEVEEEIVEEGAA